MIMKSDGEASILAVKEAVMKYHGGKMMPEMLAKGETPENGFIEEGGKTIRKYFCAFISQAEEGMGETLTTGCNLHLWAVRWAAICYSRYAVGKDGRTAYERLRGRTSRSVVVPFGEKVWCRDLESE